MPHYQANHNHVQGCRIEYLSPYSPDYNPIEQAFSAIKAHLRRLGLSFYAYAALYYELYRACEIITPEMTWGFFSHAGYL
jgi:transposase